MTSTVIAASNPPVTSTLASSGACINKAAFYSDVTVPDKTVFNQGEEFVKTWKIRNVGTCDWDKNYSLVFTKGDLPAESDAYSLPNPVKAGDTVDISVKMKAPSGGGQHYSDWWLRDNQGTLFGFGSGGYDYIWAMIVVSWPVPANSAQNVSYTPSTVSTACSVQQNPDYLSQLLDLINQARAAQGVSPLEEQDQLMAAAQGHSVDMACNDFMSHTGSDNSSWYDRVSAQGYSYQYASENIYVGDPAYGGTAEGAFSWWMNSQVHRDNILSPKVTQIGIGYAYYSNSTYGGYYTLDFAHP